MAGGFFPVAARQVVLRPFFATAAAPRAATREKADHALLLDPDAMTPPYPERSAWPPALAALARAAARRSGRRELISQ